MRGAVIGLLLGLSLTVGVAAEDEDVRNYAEYSATFASAGQPTQAQLKMLIEGGVQRIIYIAYSDHKGSLAAEDRLVRDLGAEYIQIPVAWQAPARADYDLFAAVMNAAPAKPTLLHCQANFRASAFAMLYRVLEQGVPVAQAKADMNAVWTPNETWTDFVRQVLMDEGIDPDCEGCDWTPWQPE
ncbi:MAG: protein tyrosine phosphatase family protein [Pseudomonadota bacterium]